MASGTIRGRGRDTTRTRLFILFGIVMAAMSFIPACSGKDFAALRPGIESRGHYIEGVPFYRQSESTCGPAALACILAFWGHPVDLEQITAKIYLPELRGTLPMDLENYAREAGFITASSSGTLEGLKALIRKGTPIICMLDFGFGFYRQPHYVSVVGFDDAHAVIIEHDGSKPNSLIGYDKFDKVWNRAGRWMLLITPETGGPIHEP
jgi:ABC-type bacteriocin/lantibiotic exporter with double-glycine peptidase domain